jgi:hypothetical protein
MIFPLLFPSLHIFIDLAQIRSPRTQGEIAGEPETERAPSFM